MTSILAVLILSSGFLVAIETESGFVEKSFENTKAGAEEFWTFAEPILKKEGKRVKVCTVSTAADPGAIMEWLLEEEFGPALLSSQVFESYADKNGLPKSSATTVARACLETLPFISRAR
jgi:hypothetical protein